MYFTVYKITNMINGKIYVGVHKTNNLDDGYMGSGKLIIRAQEKYGIENFKKEILAIFDNPDEMFQMESEIVNDDFVSDETTYNLKNGGDGGAVMMKNTKYYSSGRHSENYKSARNKADQANKKALETRISLYNENPNTCKCCSSPLDYKSRKNKYCSKSCAAKVNNIGVNRHRKLMLY